LTEGLCNFSEPMIW